MEHRDELRRRAMLNCIMLNLNNSSGQQPHKSIDRVDYPPYSLAAQVNDPATSAPGEHIQTLEAARKLIDSPDYQPYSLVAQVNDSATSPPRGHTQVLEAFNLRPQLPPRAPRPSLQFTWSESPDLNTITGPYYTPTRNLGEDRDSWFTRRDDDEDDWEVHHAGHVDNAEVPAGSPRLSGRASFGSFNSEDSSRTSHCVRDREDIRSPASTRHSTQNKMPSSSGGSSSTPSSSDSVSRRRETPRGIVLSSTNSSSSSSEFSLRPQTPVPGHRRTHSTPDARPRYSVIAASPVAPTSSSGSDSSRIVVLARRPHRNRRPSESQTSNNETLSAQVSSSSSTGSPAAAPSSWDESSFS